MLLAFAFILHKTLSLTTHKINLNLSFLFFYEMFNQSSDKAKKLHTHISPAFTHFLHIFVQRTINEINRNIYFLVLFLKCLISGENI